MSESKMDVLRHMLGLNQSVVPYRNYFAADPDDETLLEMEREGMVVCYREPDDYVPYRWYSATEAGRLAALGEVGAFEEQQEFSDE